MGHVSLFKHIILQPITVCNLNCRYCYLPDRDKVERMTRRITEAIAKSIEILKLFSLFDMARRRAACDRN